MRLTNQRFLGTILGALVILSFVKLTAAGQAFGASESVIWSFDNGTNGTEDPFSGVIMDKNGNLYGATVVGGAYGQSQGGDGTVFELTPPSISGGNWTESVLWNFGNNTDGRNPYGRLIMDKTGNLYGTTRHGGIYGESNVVAGTVFELTPPSSSGGPWTETILWSFGNGMDGDDPDPGLVMDTSGNLYGTTAGGGANSHGTVFKLTPPSSIGGNWTESTVWSFSGTDGEAPNATLIMDKSGNLYGTTSLGGTYGVPFSFNGGTVFELVPPSTAGQNWTESVLWNFGNGTDGDGPAGPLIMDSSGDLYGTTQFGGAYWLNENPPPPGGTVFKLIAPPNIGGNWTESILWSFGNGTDGSFPRGDLTVDARGNLYGVTIDGGANSDGTVFELTPPSSIGGDWTEIILWSFNGTDGKNPTNGLISDTVGNLYGAGQGGASEDGTVFEVSPTGNPAELTTSPTTLSFGKLVATATSKPKKVTLANRGKAAAVISSVTATAPFTIAGGADTCTGKTIAPKKTCSFYVEYAPTTVGEVGGGSIDVAYNGTSPALALKGNCIAVTLKATKSASFAPVSAGSLGTPKNILFSNPSTVTVTFGTAELGGSNPGSFKIAGDQCSGQALAPKSKCGIGVEFAPPGNASGTQGATLSVEVTYGANQDNLSANLSGKVK